MCLGDCVGLVLVWLDGQDGDRDWNTFESVAEHAVPSPFLGTALGAVSLQFIGGR